MVRLVRRLLAMTVMPAALGGCLVTSDPDFQGQDECVPSFVSIEADPANTVTINKTDPTDGANEFRASVPVRSCALTKDYTVHVFVDNDFVDIDRIPPNGEDVRNVSVLIDLTKYTTPGCHRVELYISTNFQDRKTPVRAGDVDTISWFYANDPDASALGCGTL